MGAAEAYQAGGWPLVTIILAGSVIFYLARKVDRLERRDDERNKAVEALMIKREERDQERLKMFEDRERREQEGRA